jgi:hypothetical protein
LAFFDSAKLNQRVNHRLNVKQLQRSAAKAAHCHSEVSTAVVHLNAIKSASSSDNTETEDVQARARWRNFYVGAFGSLNNRRGPSGQSAIGKAMVKVNAGNALTVKHEADAITDARV